jgi:D-alanyl-D-alanine carboxypeptidase (penicillin-binding protein 5/6)
VEVANLKYKINKVLSFTVFVLLIMTIFTIKPLSTHAAGTLDIAAESAILVDGETGKILYSKNPDMALPPASMTKMMTEYLVWEAVESGKISWDTTTQISDYAYSISANINFSGIGLRQNIDYTVQDLYEAMAINSDNATTIALAELIASSEGEFVKLMNQKAEEMGLQDTEFVNTTGLENNSLGENYPEGTDPNGTNLLSARSAALLAFHLINDYPESLNISKIPETEFDGKSIINWNWMLAHEGDHLKQYYYEGVDGLKTGYTDLAGYCFTGTAERNGQRLIAVVMKTDSEDLRFKETAKLFDYGYTQFKTEEIFPAGYQLEDQVTVPVVKGKEKTVKIATEAAFHLPVKEDQKDKFTVKYNFDEKLFNKEGELTAPIKKGQKVGTAELVYEDEKDFGYIIDGSDQKVVDLVTIETVEKNNWFMITIGAIGDFFANLFTSIVDMIKGWF